MTQQFYLTEELNLAENFLKNTLHFFNRTYHFIMLATGFVGMIFFLPAIAVIGFALWLTLKLSNKKLERIIKAMFSQIDKEDQRTLMMVHHGLKNRRIEADEMLKKTKSSSKFFLLKPVYGQVKYSREIFINAENRLHKTLYPAYYQPLSEDQKQQLSELSKNLEGIWEDDDCLVNN